MRLQRVGHNLSSKQQLLAESTMLYTPSVMFTFEYSYLFQLIKNHLLNTYHGPDHTPIS